MGFPVSPCARNAAMTSSEESGFWKWGSYKDANLLANPCNVVPDRQFGVLFAMSDVATQTARAYTSRGKWILMSRNMLTPISSF